MRSLSTGPYSFDPCTDESEAHFRSEDDEVPDLVFGDEEGTGSLLGLHGRARDVSRVIDAEQSQRLRSEALGHRRSDLFQVLSEGLCVNSSKLFQTVQREDAWFMYGLATKSQFNFDDDLAYGVVDLTWEAGNGWAVA